MRIRLISSLIGMMLLSLFFTLPSTSYAATDKEKPAISGASNKTIYIGTSFNTLSGVSAKDNVDGNITKNIKVTGSVNVKKEGKYKLTYTISDKAKNKATVTRTITVKKDTVNPSISGASNKTVYIGSSFNALSGVSAKDNVDGTITKNVKVSGSVNLKKEGKYKLTYTVSDKAKNKATVTRTITVKKDTVKPSISGASDKTIYIGSSFNALSGVSAKDNVDGTITKNIKVSGSVNLKKEGKYKLTYTASDKAKNKATVTRTITVKKDKTKPTISGASNKTINIGSSFNSLSGVSAKDNVDGTITKYIKISGKVDVNKAGSYKLTYSITDKAKNTTTVTRTITVKDNVKPVISGAKNSQINIGTAFNPLSGVSAKDNNDGTITSAIKVNGTVISQTAGKYVLTYTVSDKAGNTATVTRTITVIDNIAPVISGVKDKEITVGESFDMLEGITALDNNDGDITSTISVDGTVDFNKAGNYALTYSVMDKAGNLSTANSTIKVIDNTSPIISGAEDLTIGLNEAFNLLNGVIATDNNDGDISAFITTNGSVDPSREGTYIVTYTVSDAAGNKTELKRTVTVKIINVSNLSIYGSSTMKSGKTQQLTTTVYPANATNQQVTWSSSDESLATVNEKGLVTSLSEGTVTITAVADGVQSSITITISDKPNLYVYQSGSVTINNVIKSLSISMYNRESTESVEIEKVEIYEDGSLFSTYSKEQLTNSGIETTVQPYSDWGISFSFKLGLWANKSEVIVTVKNSQGKTYEYSLNI